jgi:acetylornithine deacetylase/succinyl-diaminopimelate desuccinylase-like protein
MTTRLIDNYIATHHGRHLAELMDYVSIPSVSALPSHAADMRRCAEWTAAALHDAGLEHVRVIETAGNPIVYGDWLYAPGAPTVLCYGHYDVQPVDPEELWNSPPFQGTIRDGKLYARGATDDKGQLFIHVKAIEAHLRTVGRLPINISFIVEGEEEIGCAHLSAFVRENAALLAADVVVDSDSAMFADGVPSISCAMRGIACFQLDVRGSAADLHSGSFGGGVANPAFVLANLVAQLKDRDGRVAIPGFYDDVRELTPEERSEIASLQFDDRQYRAALGVPALFGEAGYTTLERTWARPTVEVNGLSAGFTSEGFKTVIPATAMARISMRLVPDQDPVRVGDLFAAFLASVAPPSVTYTLTRLHGGRPWSVRADDPFLRAAARAMAHGFGKEPLFTREGGSNPIVAVFEEILGAPTIMFGIGLPDENPHAPNEHLHLENFRRGIIAAARLYCEFAQ